jgi:hypothetical protein
VAIETLKEIMNRILPTYVTNEEPIPLDDIWRYRFRDSFMTLSTSPTEIVYTELEEMLHYISTELNLQVEKKLKEYRLSGCGDKKNE